MKKQIGVVIVNYNQYEETLACVCSLLQQKDVILRIAVIDNGSSNESYGVLERTFRDNPYVEVLKSDRNLGYARGNNLGIDYLRKSGVSDIFVSNSDLLFSDHSILSSMLNAVDEKTGIIVPTIRNPDGHYDQRVLYQSQFIRLRLIKQTLRATFRDFLRVKFNKLNESNLTSKELILNRDYDRITNWEHYYVISGSGYLITSAFFLHYNGMYPETFLYGEEECMILMLLKAGLKTKVVNTGVVVHKGGASTPQQIQTKSKKRAEIELNSDYKILKLFFMPPLIAKKRY